MKEIGIVQYLQIQTMPLKTIVDGVRTYQTSAIQRCEALSLTKKGIVVEQADGTILDVHHENHPKSRYRGDNSLSVAWLPNYDAMRERFGDHMQVGIAGENIIINPHASPIVLRETMHLLIGDPQSRHSILAPLEAAPPCIEFSQFCLQSPSDAQTIKETLQFLEGGLRGFYTHVHSGTSQVRVGDSVYLLD